MEQGGRYTFFYGVPQECSKTPLFRPPRGIAVSTGYTTYPFVSILLILLRLTRTHLLPRAAPGLPRAIAPSPFAMATSPHRPYPLRGCAAPVPCSAMVGPCRPRPAWPRRRTAPAPQLVGSHGAVVVHHVHVPVIVPVQRIQPLLRRSPTAGAAPGSPVDRRRRVG